jgi:valyl-tRNA synthetase
MSIAPKGQDIRFSEERIEQGRNFCNKLWNVSRFRQMADEQDRESTLTEIIARIVPAQLNQDDHAILLRLVQTLDEVERLYLEYEFNSVLHAIYRFFWNDLCDWYVENSKPRMRGGDGKDTCLAVQDLCLRQVLLLLHPVTPFITEELWKVLGFSGGRSIQWSKPGTGSELDSLLSGNGIKLDSTALEEMLAIRELVTSMRALKADRNLANNNKVEFSYLADEEKSAILNRHLSSVLSSVGAAALNRVTEAPTGMPALVTAFGSVYMDLASGIDVKAEKARLTKEIEGLEKIISSIENKLGNPAFTGKAPPPVVDGARRQLAENHAKKQETEDALRALS